MWAFFDSRALATWWHVTRSVTVPRVLGAYAVEWEPTDTRMKCSAGSEGRSMER